MPVLFFSISLILSTCLFSFFSFDLFLFYWFVSLHQKETLIASLQQALNNLSAQFQVKESKIHHLQALLDIRNTVLQESADALGMMQIRIIDLEQEIVSQKQQNQHSQERLHQLETQLFNVNINQKRSEQEAERLRDEGRLQMLSEWKQSVSLNAAYELSVGLSLTREQLNGVRWTLSHRFDGSCFKKKRLQCMDMPVPSIPCFKSVSKKRKAVSHDCGVQKLNPTCYILDVDHVVIKAKLLNPHKICGLMHLQVLVFLFISSFCPPSPHCQTQ